MKAEVFDAIRALEDAEGRLTPQAVVAAARDEDSPLHGHFIWDDAKAAAKHRLDTARRLIVQVEIKVRYGAITLASPVYLHDPDLPPKVSGYRNVMRLKTDADAAHEALVAEMERVASILKRARNIAIVLGQSDTLDDLDRQVSQFVGSLASSPPS